MRRFLIAFLLGAVALSPGAVQAQTSQAQAIAGDWFTRFLHRPLDGGGLIWARDLDQGQDPTKLAAAVIGSDEYYLRAGGTATGFVQNAFTDIGERPPTPEEYAFWLSRLVQVGGNTPDFEARSDLAYEMLVRYPQYWQTAAPVVVAPTVIAPTVVVPPVLGYDRRFHDRDDHFEYHRPVYVPLRHDFDHHADHGHDDHDHRVGPDHKR